MKEKLPFAEKIKTITVGTGAKPGAAHHCGTSKSCPICGKPGKLVKVTPLPTGLLETYHHPGKHEHPTQEQSFAA